MTETKSSAKYWVYFFIWVGILFLFILFYPQLLWMTFPGIFTNFALALKLM